MLKMLMRLLGRDDRTFQEVKEELRQDQLKAFSKRILRAMTKQRSMRMTVDVQDYPLLGTKDVQDMLGDSARVMYAFDPESGSNMVWCITWYPKYDEGVAI